MKHIFSLFLILSFLTGCNVSDNKNNYYHSKLTNSKELFFLDSIQVNYTNKSVIGEIGAFAMNWKNYFLLIDVANTQIVVFNRKFDFIKKMGRQGRGPGEYVYSPFFIFNEISSCDSLYLFSPRLRKINIYDNKLNYVGSENLDDEFIYQLTPALKSKNSYVFSAVYPYSVMKKEYYTKYKSLITLDNKCKFKKEILDWGKIYYNEKILGFLGTNNSTLLDWGYNNQFFALQRASFYIYELNKDFEVIKIFGRKPKYYKTLPKEIDPIKTQQSFKSFVEYKTNVTDFVNIKFDKTNKNIFVQYLNVTPDEIYKKNKFAGEWYLQVYNSNFNVIYDNKINGILLFVDNGIIYILKKETPKYFVIKKYKLTNT